jgi:hypothetical protein
MRRHRQPCGLKPGRLKDEIGQSMGRGMRLVPDRYQMDTAKETIETIGEISRKNSPATASSSTLN